MGLGLLPGIRKTGMIIYIENTPDLVIAEKFVASAAGLALGFVLHCDGSLNQCLRVFSVPLNNDLYQRIAELRTDSSEISRLSLSAFAEDQDAPSRLPAGAATREISCATPAPLRHSLEVSAR